jgi:hypothetical protein
MIEYKGGAQGITLESFELSKIDDMRELILAAPKTAPFNITTQANFLPYSASIANATVNEKNTNGNNSYFNQAGLGIKTYLSDRFNNWLSTEWIDGEGGIADISSVDVSDGMLKNGCTDPRKEDLRHDEPNRRKRRKLSGMAGSSL